MKSKIARKLRDLADRIDRSTGPRAFGGYFNHTRAGTVVTVTEGIRVHPEVPGCPLWFMEEDYERSFEGLE